MEMVTPMASPVSNWVSVTLEIVGAILTFITAEGFSSCCSLSVFLQERKTVAANSTKAENKTNRFLIVKKVISSDKDSDYSQIRSLIW